MVHDEESHVEQEKQERYQPPFLILLQQCIYLSKIENVQRDEKEEEDEQSKKEILDVEGE